MKKNTKTEKLAKDAEISCSTESGHRNCPVFVTLGLIGNKWSIALLSQMLGAPDHTLRFNALRKVVPGISQGELTKYLRLFEESGIVVRTIYPEVPPRVEYTLTEMGRSLCGPIKALHGWAVEHSEQIAAKRESYNHGKVG